MPKIDLIIFVEVLEHLYAHTKTFIFKKKDYDFYEEDKNSCCWSKAKLLIQFTFHHVKTSKEAEVTAICN
ncbi:MAG TPA: hypothetical protein HA298_00520 [Methanobacteriales archaeon]|nr:hypothetical protein [Methanobacteriales archaeon]